MVIHIFGKHLDKFNPHIHTILAGRLYTDNNLFYVMEQVDLKPLEELFRAEIFKYLNKERRDHYGKRIQ